ncbi:MAG: hypothetical protein WC260_01310 [Candidatus Pacearchaeota archaeon]
MGEKDIKNVLNEKISKSRILFKHIKGNCKTIFEIKRYHEDFILIINEKKKDKNIFEILNFHLLKTFRDKFLKLPILYLLWFC